ncbi:hypothetical protein [Fodinicola feengrottensis]|uniref:hypothetical protein n=1 Tax=Fodinicola feengrottensis TaxID=435914 RepID=UPI0013D25FF0|nr:hypothetical protein [Fodinicola feengrottensis]
MNRRAKRVAVSVLSAVAGVALMVVAWGFAGQSGVLLAGVVIAGILIAVVAARQGVTRIRPARAAAAASVAQRRRVSVGRLVTVASWSGGSQRGLGHRRTPHPAQTPGRAAVRAVPDRPPEPPGSGPHAAGRSALAAGRPGPRDL